MNPDQTATKATDLAEYGMTGTPAIIGLIVLVLGLAAVAYYFMKRRR